MVDIFKCHYYYGSFFNVPIFLLLLIEKHLPEVLGSNLDSAIKVVLIKASDKPRILNSDVLHKQSTSTSFGKRVYLKFMRFFPHFNAYFGMSSNHPYTYGYFLL